MAKQSTEVGEKLISLMVPDVDLDLVQLVLRRMASLVASGRAGREGQREGRGNDQARVLQEQVELLALLRDADIDQAQLRAFPGVDPDSDDTRHAQRKI
jgi:hypothetical protein